MIKFASATAASVTISWRKSSDNRRVAGYHLYRGEERVGSTTGTQYTFSGLRCGASYQFGVEAYDSSGNRSARASIVAATRACVDVTAPSEPSGIARVGATSDSVTVGWAAASDDVGVVEYEILRDGGIVGTTATTNYSIAPLQCATMYTIGIRARDAAGNRSTAGTLLTSTAACPDTSAPTAPGSVAVTSINETSIAVAWTASMDDRGVQGYTVYRDGQPAGSTSSTAYTVSGLACGQSYGIAVDAYDSAGNRSARSGITLSTSACAAPPDPGPTPDTTAPTAPSGVSVGGTTAQSITITWTTSADNVGVAGYSLYRDGVRVATASQPSATFSALTCGRSYQLGVDAYDAAGNRSARANVVASTAPCPDTSPPADPTGLTQVSATETTAVISWSASTDNVGVAGYGVYLGGVRIANVASPGYTFPSLSCGTTFTVGVDAYDVAGGRSSQSTIALTTLACPTDTEAPSVPQNQSVGNTTPTSFRMSWTASTDNVGVTGYTVYLDGTRVTTTTTTAHTYSGLTCGRTYTVALEAFDSAGNVSSRAQASGLASTLACSSGDATPPSVPVVTVGSRTASSITVSWSAATDNVGVTGYGYYRDGGLVGNGTETSYTFGALACGTSYAFAIDAYDAAGNRSAKGSTTASTTACEQPPAGGGSAVLYLSPNGSDAGSCTQSSPCASFQRAYALAPAGATVRVAGGTYPSQAITAVSGKTGPNVVFEEALGERVVLHGLRFGVASEPSYGPDYITVRGLETSYSGQQPAPDNQRGIWLNPGTTNVVLDQIDAGNFHIWGAEDVTVRGGDWGPCSAVWPVSANVCGNSKIDSWDSAGFRTRNISIDGAYFHDYRFDDSCWASGADCHWECLFLNASENVTIKNSRFVGCAIFDIFVTFSGPDATKGHDNLKIENNWFAAPFNEPSYLSNSRTANSVMLAHCEYAPSDGVDHDGLRVRFNSFAGNANVVGDGTGCAMSNGAYVVGNIGAKTGCISYVNYRSNVFTTGQGQSGGCDPSDRNIGISTAPYVADTNSSALDHHLGIASSADNFVPASVLGGCPATDFDGTPRSSTTCDAGADER